MARTKTSAVPRIVRTKLQLVMPCGIMQIGDDKLLDGRGGGRGLLRKLELQIEVDAQSV